MKKQIYKVIAVIIIVFGISLMLYAFSIRPMGNEKEKKTLQQITFAAWGDDQYQEILEQTALEFQNRENIEVEVFCFSSEQELEKQIFEKFAIGDPYDVFLARRNLLQILIQEEWIENLSSVLDNRRKQGDEYYTNALIEGYFDGVQCGMPTGMNPYVLICNDDLLKECGLENVYDLVKNRKWNMDAFQECVETIYEKYGTPGLLIENTKTAWENLIKVEGGEISIEDGRVKLDNQAQYTKRKLQSYLRKGIIQCIDEKEEIINKNAIFFNSKILFLYGDLSDMSALGDFENVNCDILPVPSENGNFSNSVVEIPMILASKEGNLEASKQFIDFYVGADGQKTRLEYGEKLLPSLNTVYYTGKEAVYFPEHSNYFIYAIEQGYSDMYNGEVIEEEDFLEQLLGKEVRN